MKKLILISILGIFIFLIGINPISADLCKNNYGYYSDCSYSSSIRNYGNYNIANKASVPVFKGPYGNYRYKMYESGDYSLAPWFTSYGAYGGGPYFSGGYYGYYGYGRYYSRFSWFWW